MKWCSEKQPQPHGKAKDNSKLVKLANVLREGAVKRRSNNQPEVVV